MIPALKAKMIKLFIALGILVSSIALGIRAAIERDMTSAFVALLGIGVGVYFWRMDI